ncbi:hypothetical protein HMPREF2955_14060 [Prevotella sp. HMSC073D09]|jgi:type I DNA specificity S subunit|uniref:restriction endonuclease subunit S n=1 Tax=Prevotella sp. HMSC073D09 TaxID=1739459 RepID=UPI0008A5EE8E|nr:restriction endonuclease subunit S [Prevotella sp. HMSC073D09]OFQ12416.1 hypothetical protein HMPREF2955_14060 [Prevotella sp. HMSC073D09]
MKTCKNSGIKWIGNVPKHWEISKLKKHFIPRNQKVSDKDYAPLSVTKDGVLPQLDTACKTENGENRKLVCKGDYVVNSRSDRKGSGGVSPYDGSVSLINIVMEPTDGERAYYHYLFRCNNFVEEFYRNGRGIVSDLWTTRYQEMRNIDIPIPPLAEQRAIVSYLDGKVGQIDTYVAKQTQQIELLKELKQAVIANAVTKGIDTNPNAKRKQSGVNWLGEIPEHWEVSKLRKHFIPRIQKVSDKDFAPLSVTKDGILPQLDTACKTDNGENRKLVRKGDYVVNSRSDRKGSGGISPFDGSVSLINIVIYPIDGEQEYYHYLFRCNNFVEEFYRNGRGIVADLWTTRYQEMKNIEIPIPPLSEQRAIVSYIEAKTASINKLIDAYEQQVERVKEYKQRLISDAVTGKMNVTDEQTQTN